MKDPTKHRSLKLALLTLSACVAVACSPCSHPSSSYFAQPNCAPAEEPHDFGAELSFLQEPGSPADDETCRTHSGVPCTLYFTVDADGVRADLAVFALARSWTFTSLETSGPIVIGDATFPIELEADGPPEALPTIEVRPGISTLLLDGEDPMTIELQADAPIE